MKKYIGLAVFLALFALGASIRASAQKADCPALQAGDLFKVPNNSAVYLLNDGLRRMYFPTSEVFHSWYDDFSSVREIPYECVDDYPIPDRPPYGVNYRAGAKLVKIKISPYVYVVEPGNKIRKLKDESIARELYGPNWANLVRDVADAFWPNYTKAEEGLDEVKPHDGMFVKTPTSTEVYYVENGELVKVDKNPEEDVRTIGYGVFSKLAVRSGIIETKKAYERPEQKTRNENAATPAVPADTASSTPAIPAVPADTASSTPAIPAVPSENASSTGATPKKTNTGVTTTPSTYCGDGACNGNEVASNCAVDCVVSIVPPPSPTNSCGNGVCDSNETSSSCSADCPGTSTPTTTTTATTTTTTDATSTGTATTTDGTATTTGGAISYCGNGVCDSNETSSSCSADCLEQSATVVNCKDILVVNEANKYAYWGWYGFHSAGDYNGTYEPNMSHSIWPWLDRTIQWASGKTDQASTHIALFTYNGNENREPFTNAVSNEASSRTLYRYLVLKGYNVTIISQQQYPSWSGLSGGNYDLIWYNSTYSYSPSLALQSGRPIITVSPDQSLAMGIGKAASGSGAIGNATAHKNISSMYVKNANHSISSPAGAGEESISSIWTDSINGASGMSVLVSMDNTSCGSVGAAVNSDTKLVADDGSVKWPKTGLLYRLAVSFDSFIKSLFLFVAKAMGGF